MAVELTPVPAVGSVTYLERLSAALEKRGQWLTTVQIPRLMEALASYDSLFEGVIAIVIRKGVLREDPYNYAQAFTEIVIPGDEALPDFESSDDVSFRLAAFRQQLKYVSTEYRLDLKTLTLVRLKKLSGLVSYLNWNEFGGSSKSPTTRALAHAFMKVRTGADPMASQILKDSESQIVRTVGQIRILLAELFAYSRESWKAELRRAAVPAPPSSGRDAHGRPDMTMNALRRAFLERMAGRPWYPSLVEEILSEELTPEGPEKKEKNIASLIVVEQETVKMAPAPVCKDVLLDAVRLLAHSHAELSGAALVLEENEKLLLGSPGTEGGWFRRLLGSRSRSPVMDHLYKVQYTVPGTPSAEAETVDFEGFAADVHRKASLLNSIASGAGPAYKKLEATGENQIAGFIDKQFQDLRIITRRLGSFNTLFQERFARERKTARGIKVELLTIKNSIAKASERRQEYKGGDRGGSTCE